MSTVDEPSARGLSRLIRAVETSDGAGVRLRRSLGSRSDLRLDPFLLLDEFATDNPQDYIAGFPPHPHRGFETVTYMLAGRMRHEDHLGNRGDLGPGDVQWMTAGRGIIHSEMPQQIQGRMHGFQLWINLPAREKMTPAAYRDLPSDAIPRLRLAGGGSIKVIAGSVADGEHRVSGPINPPTAPLATAPLYLDLELPAGVVHRPALPVGHNAFVYVYEGALGVGEDAQPVPAHCLGMLGDGAQVRLQALDGAARALLIAGKPLREPVAQYGPFVMNTREEIEQALADYRDGTLTATAGSS